MGRQSWLRLRLHLVGIIASCAMILLVLVSSANVASANRDRAVGQTIRASQLSGNITYSYWSDPIRTQVTNAVIKLFEKAYPNIHVTGEPLGWDPYWQHITVEAAAGTLPCVTQVQSTSLETYTRSNVFINLNSVIKQGLLSVKGISKTVLDTGVINGTLYMVPYGAAYDALAYNKTLVAKAGLQPPKPGWSYADFGKWLAALQAKLPAGTYATDQTGLNSTAFFNYALSHGYSMFNEAGQLGFPAALLQSFWAIYLNWQKKGIAVPQALAAQEPNNVEQSFLVRGKVAVEGEPGNQFPDVVSGAAQTHVGSMGLILYPYGPRGLGQIILTSGLSIPKNCNETQAAAAFINFFTNNPAAANAYASNNGANTVTALLSKQIASPSTAPAVKQYLQTYNFIAVHKQPLVQYPPGYTQVFSNLWPVEFGKILSGSESLSAGVKSFMQQAKVDLSS